MLKASVLALGVLANDDNVDIVVASGEAGEIKTMDEGSVEIEVLAQEDIEGADASADGGSEATLETNLVLLDGLDDLRWDGVHVAVDMVLFKIKRGVHRVHDLFDGAGDEWTDSITRNESDRAGDVGNGSEMGED